MFLVLLAILVFLLGFAVGTAIQGFWLANLNQFDGSPEPPVIEQKGSRKA